MINLKKLKALMVLSGINRKSLSDSLGITYQTMTKKMNGKVSFKDHELKKISEILKASVSDLYE